MEQHEENAPFENEYIKLNELCKFAQRGETSDILQDISYPKVKKIINQYARERNSKYDKTNFRYNTLFNKNRNYKSNDNNEFNSIYIDNNKNNENEKIFTRINTNMNNNKIVKSRNQGNIDRDDDDNKIYDSYTKLPQNKYVYKKFKTPDRKFIYYRKKKKRESTDNSFSLTSNSESNYLFYKSTYENDIYDSLDEENKTLKPEYYNKKINKLIKMGLKFELNNDTNKYIDLLTISDIKELETKINIKKLSKKKINQNNKRKNNNIYIRKKRDTGKINLNKNNNQKTRNNKSELIIEDSPNKSYDCITFRKKKELNKKRKIKKINNSKSMEKNLKRLILDDKGTPIKKENDLGGKIEFKPYYKYNINYIKRVVLIQRAIRKFLNRKYIGKIYMKKTTLKVIHKNKDNKINDLDNNNNEINDENENYNNKNINEDYVNLIQRVFRQYLNNKINKEKNTKNIINYIPKNICEITKININPIKNTVRNKKIINNNIRTIKYGNINKNNDNNKENIDENSKDNDKNKRKVVPLAKKHRYTKSKLALSPLNKILISQDTVRYETDRYTFLKKCHFRNREEDKEENEIYKACTKEFMRKINLKIEGRYLTPDRKSNIIVNPSLQIDNLGEECNIQFLNIKTNKIDKSEANNKNDEIDRDNSRENNNNNFRINNYKKTNIYNKIIEENPIENENEINNDKIEEKKEENSIEKIKNINHNNINNLVEESNIPFQVITKCKIDEIVINKDKNKNILKCPEEEEKQEEEEKKKKLKKIILIQKNIRIFLEKLRPKITKNKKRVLLRELKEKEPNDKKEILCNHESNKISNNDEENNKENDDKNENLEQPKENKTENNLDNNINNDAIIDESNNYSEIPLVNKISTEAMNINSYIKEKNNSEMLYINKIPNKAINIISKNNDINNDEMIYTNKKPGKTVNMSGQTNNLKNDEIQYIEKIPGKVKNINTQLNNNENDDTLYMSKKPTKATNINTQLNNKENDDTLYMSKKPTKAININSKIDNNDNSEMLYLNKIPGKTKDITKNLNMNIDNNGMEYINKIPGKVVGLEKNKNIINFNIEAKDENSNSSSIQIDNNRNSCPLKKVQKVIYKINKKETFQKFIKDNATISIIRKLKNIGMHYKYFRFEYILRMFIQKIQKINKQFVFLKLKGEGFFKKNSYFFEIIKTYLSNPNLYINFDNDVSTLLKDTLHFYSNFYNKHQCKFIPYIRPDDEEKLINTELFRHDGDPNKLIAFISHILHNQTDLTNITDDLIRYYLSKNRIRNFNIFGITRYTLVILNRLIRFSKLDAKEMNKDENLNLDYIQIQIKNENIIMKKYIRKTMNYKKPKKISMIRHVSKLSSCDINNNSYENLPDVNDSLIKKNI